MIATAALTLALGAGLIATLWFVRLLLGPAPLDRVGAAHAFGQSCVVLIGALSVALARTQWMDIAFSMLLGGLALSIAALKVARYKSLQPRLAQTRHAREEAP